MLKPGEDNLVLDYSIAFGGIFLFALVGFVYCWFTTGPYAKDRDRAEDEQPR